MRLWRYISQLETEQAQVLQALGDANLEDIEQEGYTSAVNPDWVDGYWYGRHVGLRAAISEAHKIDSLDKPK